MTACWILTNERSGSTYLCDVLNGTGLFETEFCERFNHIIPKSFANFRQSPHDFCYTKLQPRQHIEKAGAISLESIKNHLPGIQFILLKRNDIFAKAVSLYFCFKTKKYIMTSDTARVKGDPIQWAFVSPEAYNNMSIELDAAALIESYKQVAREHTYWDTRLEGEDYLLVDYDDLMQDPVKEVGKILDYLNKPITDDIVKRAISECKLQSMTRPETPLCIAQLKELAGHNKVSLL